MRIFGFLFIFLTKTIQDNFTPSFQCYYRTVHCQLEFPEMMWDKVTQNPMEKKKNKKLKCRTIVILSIFKNGKMPPPRRFVSLSLL